jgi:Carboxypeptidase regulatory-like domain
MNKMAQPISFPVSFRPLSFKRLTRSRSLLCFILLTSATALAQFTAGIQGNVRDAAGANLPSAQMTLLNTATKVEQAGTSDASGLYRFTNLSPGEYKSPHPQRASSVPRPSSRSLQERLEMFPSPSPSGAISQTSSSPSRNPFWTPRTAGKN